MQREGVLLVERPAQSFDDAQYPVLAALLGSVALCYPIAAVAGHEHVAPGRKLDPGPGFDWARLRAALGWPARCFPAEP